MRDHDLPIAIDDIDLAFEDYVDWSGVDFLKNTNQPLAVAAMPAASPDPSPQDRTLFRTALIATVLEADAIVKSQAFYEWLNLRQQVRERRAMPVT